MIDEATAELLSRLLDGDLEGSERTDLEVRLEGDAGLRAELEALRRMQAATRAVADRMEPPAALDAMLEPLRTEVPHEPRRIRPVVRWLGMAAGLALAVTVAMEVSRRSSDHIESTRPGKAAPVAGSEMTEIDQLEPLPTSPASPAEERVGVTDRLLASPPAAAALDEPESLVVQGPLPVAGNEAGLDSRDEAKDDAAGRSRRESVGFDRPGAAVARGKVAAAPAAVDASAAGKKFQQGTAATRVFLLNDDGVQVGELQMSGPWPDHSLRLVVTIADGVIVAVSGPRGDKDGLAAREEPPSGLLGAMAPGIADGRYLATPASE